MTGSVGPGNTKPGVAAAPLGEVAAVAVRHAEELRDVEIRAAALDTVGPTLPGSGGGKVRLRVAIGVLPQRWESLQRQVESDPRVLVTRLAGDPREAIAQTGVDAILEVVSGDPPLARVVFSSARPRSGAAAGRVDAHLTAWRDLQLEQAAGRGSLRGGGPTFSDIPAVVVTILMKGRYLP